MKKVSVIALMLICIVFGMFLGASFERQFNKSSPPPDTPVAISQGAERRPPDGPVAIPKGLPEGFPAEAQWQPGPVPGYGRGASGRGGTPLLRGKFNPNQAPPLWYVKEAAMKYKVYTQSKHKPKCKMIYRDGQVSYGDLYLDDWLIAGGVNRYEGEAVCERYNRGD